MSLNIDFPRLAKELIERRSFELAIYVWVPIEYLLPCCDPAPVVYSNNVRDLVVELSDKLCATQAHIDSILHPVAYIADVRSTALSVAYTEEYIYQRLCEAVQTNIALVQLAVQKSIIPGAKSRMITVKEDYLPKFTYISNTHLERLAAHGKITFPQFRWEYAVGELAITIYS